MANHLFLFGGGPPFTETFIRLFKKVMKNETRVVLVIDRPGIDQYKTNYVEALNSVGVDCTFLTLPSKKSV
ncbi:hypothetical protein ACE1TH_13315 [Shouchella sp. JSM 1781072]|uniref:hypothetical protein n=1 Tax=Shouchella sp. JSM 1781072 TaxID=3344581 RepID=UPI0035C0DD22